LNIVAQIYIKKCRDKTGKRVYFFKVAGWRLRAWRSLRRRLSVGGCRGLLLPETWKNVQRAHERRFRALATAAALGGERLRRRCVARWMSDFAATSSPLPI
jgi:hypothetical protein